MYVAVAEFLLGPTGGYMPSPLILKRMCVYMYMYTHNPLGITHDLKNAIKMELLYIHKWYTHHHTSKKLMYM